MSLLPFKVIILEDCSLAQVFEEIRPRHSLCYSLSGRKFLCFDFISQRVVCSRYASKGPLGSAPRWARSHPQDKASLVLSAPQPVWVGVQVRRKQRGQPG